ncbi:MAG: hypothetical protein AB1416_09630 [Actinomycetota bacterium]
MAGPSSALVPVWAAATAVATSGGSAESLRWVGVAFLGASALCFAGFAVSSLTAPGTGAAAWRLTLAILAGVFLLVGVVLGTVGFLVA